MYRIQPAGRHPEIKALFPSSSSYGSFTAHNEWVNPTRKDRHLLGSWYVSCCLILAHLISCLESTKTTSAVSSTSTYDIVANIRNALYPFGRIRSFRAYCDSLALQSNSRYTTLRYELAASGVSLVDCPGSANGAEASARTMIGALFVSRVAGLRLIVPTVDAVVAACEELPPTTFVFISGDRDLAYTISTIRTRQYRVILLAPVTAHPDLKAQASVSLDFTRTVLGIHSDEFLGDSYGGQAPLPSSSARQTTFNPPQPPLASSNFAFDFPFQRVTQRNPVFPRPLDSEFSPFSTPLPEAKKPRTQSFTFAYSPHVPSTLPKAVDRPESPVGPKSFPSQDKEKETTPRPVFPAKPFAQREPTPEREKSPSPMTAPAAPSPSSIVNSGSGGSRTSLFSVVEKPEATVPTTTTAPSSAEKDEDIVVIGDLNKTIVETGSEQAPAKRLSSSPEPPVSRRGSLPALGGPTPAGLSTILPSLPPPFVPASQRKQPPPPPAQTQTPPAPTFRPLSASTLNPPARRVAPAEFATLVAVLRKASPNGGLVIKETLPGALLKTDPDTYKKAGLKKFGPYITKAVTQGIIRSTQDSNGVACVALQPEWV